jgi:hypothetical protein
MVMGLFVLVQPAIYNIKLIFPTKANDSIITLESRLPLSCPLIFGYAPFFYFQCHNNK